jgi:hypothetical protein
MRTNSLVATCLLVMFASFAATAQESRPSSRSTTSAELFQLLSGHWRSRPLKQPAGEILTFRDHVVTQVLPGGRWLVSFSGSEGSGESAWEFQAIEAIPETSSVAGVIVHGALGDVRLLHGWIDGRHLVLNELTERRTYTMDGDVMLVSREQTATDGRRSEPPQLEKFSLVIRGRDLFEPGKQVQPPKTKLEERLRELVGTWKPTGGKNLIDGTPYSCPGEVNTLLPGGWIASVTRQSPNVSITLMGVDPAGHAVAGVELASWRPTAALVSGYLDADRLVTRISGAETVWQVAGQRMTQTRRSPAYAGGRERAIFELTRE